MFRPLFILLALALASQAADSRIRININPVCASTSVNRKRRRSRQPSMTRPGNRLPAPHPRGLSADLSGFNEHGRQVGWYRREIEMPASWSGKKVFLEFQGAMQTTKLWVNGSPAGEYATTGYDSFHFDITRQLKTGKNQLAIRIDNTVNPELPPDGQKTDFIQFGGLYRDLHLVVTDPLHVTFHGRPSKRASASRCRKFPTPVPWSWRETNVRNESTSPRKCTLLTEVRDRMASSLPP